MGAHQKGVVHCGGGRSVGLRLDLAAAGQEHGTTAEGGKSKGGCPDQKGTAVHVRFPFGKMRQTKIAAKAASDR